MELDEIRMLADTSPAWRLLRARNAPLVLAFLGRLFVEQNEGARPQAALTEALDDFLWAANQQLAEGERYTGSPATYLDDWSAPGAGWLRRFYPPDGDEAHYDATPALEKAYAWVGSLRARPSIGTESRLHTLVDLLRQIVHGAQADPETRLEELRRRRAEIDAEIEEVEAGRVRVMEGAALRERYQFFASTARELLADFREVEENFRSLDRAARERIATWDGGKGDLLATLVADRADIASSDQGRSFQAFYDFLLSQERQDELADLLEQVQALEEIDVDPRARRAHHDWYDAAERTQAVVRSLSEQLRRFLDDQVWLENRRVLELVRQIEASALALRAAPPAVRAAALRRPSREPGGLEDPHGGGGGDRHSRAVRPDVRGHRPARRAAARRRTLPQLGAAPRGHRALPPARRTRGAPRLPRPDRRGPARRARREPHDHRLVARRPGRHADRAHAAGHRGEIVRPR
jgi:flagellar motility protein MotE (MotC chaperone)